MSKATEVDIAMDISPRILFEHNGFCPICETAVTFQTRDSWYRDHLFCSGCGSIPRERALMKVISDCYPNWRNLTMHESSPAGRGASTKLRDHCQNYTASHFFPEIPLGQVDSHSGYRCENLEALTFKDESFDLFITQDVMEHIFDAEAAFLEIARVLKPGGAHIFTAPLVNKGHPSEIWASRDTTKAVIYNHTPEWHGNPVDQNGSLVTMHWGYDIASFITEKAKTPTLIMTIDNIDLGIRAEYIDVMVSFKNTN